MKTTIITIRNARRTGVAFVTTLLLGLYAAPAAAQLTLPAGNTITVTGASSLRLPNGSAVNGTIDLTGAGALLETDVLNLNAGTINVSGAEATLEGDDVTVTNTGRINMTGGNTQLLTNNLSVANQGELQTSGGGARLEIQEALSVGDAGTLAMQSTTNLIQATSVEVLDGGILTIAAGETMVFESFNVEDGGILATRNNMELVNANLEGDLVFDVAGDASTNDYGRIFIEGDANVTALVTTRLQDGYQPVADQRYRLISLDQQFSQAPNLTNAVTPSPAWIYDLDRNFLDVSFDLSLPVELLTFTGYWTGKENRLDWETASETGSSHFNVERQTAAGDWVAVGRVNAAGNRQSLSTYTFGDADPGPGTLSFYRLHQVDLDGSSAYSDVISIARPGDDAVQLFPNPATDHVNVTNGGPRGFTVLDVTGKVLARGRTDASRIYRLDLPTGLRNGTYFLRLADGGVSKFTVTR